MLLTRSVTNPAPTQNKLKLMSQITNGMKPMICYSHPEPNEAKSVYELSAILGESGEHIGMVMAGISSLLIAFPFIVYTI